MRFCQYCGKQHFDEAAFCPNCGRPVKEIVQVKETTSAFSKKKKQRWVIVLSSLFIVFAFVTTLLLTSNGFDYAIDIYQYLNSDFYRASSDGMDWVLEVKAAIARLIPYYIGIGISGVLALASLVGDIIVIAKKVK